MGGEFNNEPVVTQDDDDDEPRVDMASVQSQMASFGAAMQNQGYNAGVEEGAMLGLVAGVVGTVALGVTCYMLYRQFIKQPTESSSD